MATFTYKEQFKIIVYSDGDAVGSIRKDKAGEAYQYRAHGGGERGPWLPSVDEVKTNIENPKAD